jgi:hypothetical protein
VRAGDLPKGSTARVGSRPRIASGYWRRTFACNYGAAIVAVPDLSVRRRLMGAVRRQFELLTARVQEGATPPLECNLLNVSCAASSRLTTRRGPSCS